MFHVGLPCYMGLNLGRLVSINLNKKGSIFSRKFMACACIPNVSPMFPSFPYGKKCFQWKFLFSRCKLSLRYTAGNFNENPSTSKNFCENGQASTHLIFASNSSKGQILLALSNWIGPFDTPKLRFRYLHNLSAAMLMYQ